MFCYFTHVNCRKFMNCSFIEAFYQGKLSAIMKSPPTTSSEDEKEEDQQKLDEIPLKKMKLIKNCKDNQQEDVPVGSPAVICVNMDSESDFLSSLSDSETEKS